MSRRLRWTACWALPLLLLPAAELGYRARFQWRRASLQRALEDAHAGPFVRFGEETEAPQASLFGDLTARLAGRLDGDDPRFSHAYAGLRFRTGDIVHVFYWSPRRLGFYHADNWGAGYCPLRACPWRPPPYVAGIGPSAAP